MKKLASKSHARNQEMHETQVKLIELSKRQSLDKLSLRHIAAKIGVNNAQTVKYHLSILKEKGLVETTTPTSSTTTDVGANLRLVSIPVLGTANAGVATSIVSSEVEDYIEVSDTLLKNADLNHLFAFRARGNSMNRASIGDDKLSIETDDFVIVDKNRVPKDGDYIVAVVGELANIKKLKLDTEHKQVLLISESSDTTFFPIVIDAEDEIEQLIAGTIVAVVKTP